MRRSFAVISIATVLAVAACGGGAESTDVGDRSDTGAGDVSNPDVVPAIEAILDGAEPSGGALFQETDGGEVSVEMCPILDPDGLDEVVTALDQPTGSLTLAGAEVHGPHIAGEGGAFCAYQGDDGEIALNVTAVIVNDGTEDTWTQAVDDSPTRSDGDDGTVLTAEGRTRALWLSPDGTWAVAVFSTNGISEQALTDVVTIIADALTTAPDDAPSAGCPDVTALEDALEAVTTGVFDPDPGKSPMPDEAEGAVAELEAAAQAVADSPEVPARASAIAQGIRDAARDFDELLAAYDYDIRLYTDTPGDSAIDEDVNAIFETIDFTALEALTDACQ